MKITTKIRNALFLLGLLITPQISFAECAGKIELAPAFLHIDILESGKTIKRMDMPAVRGEISYLFWQGFYIKPIIVYGNGGSAKGGTAIGSVSLGRCIPLNDKLILSPSVGIGYSHLWTKIDFPALGLENLKEKFKSLSPFVGIDAIYTIQKGLRLNLSVQYAWARTHTSIAQVVRRQKNHSQGFNYSCMVEQDLNDKWSVNVGATYSLSLSKEKHGVRGTGVKAGLARWF